jgi:hypothetical protein
MNILLPGRHHLLTDFQFKYLYRLIQQGLEEEMDVDGRALGITQKVERVIFAVTSANHANTRRNPVPFHLRAMAILDFGQELEVPCFVFPIDDVGDMPDFAAYTLKKIQHESEGMLDLRPENTLVACSSPVLVGYERLGFRILPVELKDRKTGVLHTTSPWSLVEEVAKGKGDWRKETKVFTEVHQASYLIWSRYGIGEKVRRLFSDDMISADGDLTETRDYNSYVRQMDEIAEFKYRETAPYIRPGRIGDIGCAVGAWIKLSCAEQHFRESDFFGIEVARQLYQICLQRKENGEFENPNVFFSQRNAVTGLCFAANSMNTIHTSSLTHEIESYGGHDDLLRFIQNRFEELAPGGVWVNRDVVGPENGEQEVLMWLKADDGRNEDWEETLHARAPLQTYLSTLSTHALFRRFARDFRAGSGDGIRFEWKSVGGVDYAALSLRDAMEFVSKKDYHENWLSEMHERFCFWSFSEWRSALSAAGYTIDPNSKAYTNTWLVDNRYRGKVGLYRWEDGKISPLPWPDTHMLMVAGKRV